MKLTFLIACFYIVFTTTAQTDVIQNYEYKIYNAEKLFEKAEVNGINELEGIIQLTDLVYLDSTYASKLINLEFKQGFWGKDFNSPKIKTYSVPKITIEIETQFNSSLARKKLFSYYCSIPKYIKSDTIYTMYDNLEDILKILVKTSSPELINRLKQDYVEWSILSKKTTPKKYPTREELRKRYSEEVLLKQYQTRDLYLDCSYIALQIAGALNYLKVKGFDDILLAKLITSQPNNPYVNNYSFPKPFKRSTTAKTDYIKIIKNTSSITSLTKDVSQISKLIGENFTYPCYDYLTEIIENGHSACLTYSCTNGSSFYSVKLEENNTIRIELIWTVSE